MSPVWLKLSTTYRLTHKVTHYLQIHDQCHLITLVAPACFWFSFLYVFNYSFLSRCMLIELYIQSVVADNFIFIGLSIIVVKCEHTLRSLQSPSLTEEQCIPTRSWQRKTQCLRYPEDFFWCCETCHMHRLNTRQAHGTGCVVHVSEASIYGHVPPGNLCSTQTGRSGNDSNMAGLQLAEPPARCHCECIASLAPIQTYHLFCLIAAKISAHVIAGRTDNSNLVWTIQVIVTVTVYEARLCGGMASPNPNVHPAGPRCVVVRTSTQEYIWP